MVVNLQVDHSQILMDLVVVEVFQEYLQIVFQVLYLKVLHHKQL